jgi:hypothetical protein
MQQALKTRFIFTWSQPTRCPSLVGKRIGRIQQISFRQSYYYPTEKEGITLRAELQANQRRLEVETKLDTGAAFCLFERNYAEGLGIEVESGYKRRLHTPTGSFDAYGHEVTLKTLDLEFDLTVFFAADYAIQRNLLGRNWLRLVRLGLVDYEGLLYLKPVRNSWERERPRSLAWLGQPAGLSVHRASLASGDARVPRLAECWQA